VDQEARELLANGDQEKVSKQLQFGTFQHLSFCQILYFLTPLDWISICLNMTLLPICGFKL